MMGRNDEIKKQRRRRDSSSLGGVRRRLYVDPDTLDTEKYTYRWINDNEERIYNLTQKDDWDLVTERDSATGTGSEMASQVGSGAKGSPMRAVLVRKLKEYHDADKADQQRKIDVQEKDLEANAAPGADSTKQYQPETKTKIARG